MAGTQATNMNVRVPPFLLKILNEQKTTPVTTTKIYSIVGMYYDKLITSEQVDYFIRYFWDPKASKKLQSMKDMIDKNER